MLRAYLLYTTFVSSAIVFCGFYNNVGVGSDLKEITAECDEEIVRYLKEQARLAENHQRKIKDTERGT